MDNNDQKTVAQQAIETEIEKMLVQQGMDVSDIDNYIEEHMYEYPDDLFEFAFRAAVRLVNMDYVEEHVGEIELNNGEGSSYLYETDDEGMKTLLMDNGAFKYWEDYAGCRFAMETVSGGVLAFSEDFKKQVFNDYKKKYDLTDKIIEKIINEGADNNSKRNVKKDMSMLCVSIENGTVQFEDEWKKDGYDLKELLEELGYDCDFEGDSWKLETNGVYFIE